MSCKRRPAKPQLRRSFSEQLRDSTAKAWDLLWKNVRERRLAGQSLPPRFPRTVPGEAGARLAAPAASPAALPPSCRLGPACPEGARAEGHGLSFAAAALALRAGQVAL